MAEVSHDKKGITTWLSSRLRGWSNYHAAISVKNLSAADELSTEGWFKYADVVQMARTIDLYSICRGFESFHQLSK